MSAAQPQRKNRVKARSEFEPHVRARRKQPQRAPGAQDGGATGEEPPVDRTWEVSRGAFPGDRAG